MEKILITPAGLEKIQSDLHHFKNVLKPHVIDEISKARSLGDLSENAEYHEAKKQQSFIEGKIAELEAALSFAEVIDPSLLKGNHVKFGATVTLEDQETGEVSSYQIVGQIESDIEKKLVSISSPLGLALINKTEGDYVEVSAPSGERLYKLLQVEFK